MPLYIAWGNDEQTLLLARFVSPWNANELINMIDEGVQMLTSVSHIVDVIIDFHEATTQIPTQYLPAVWRINEIGRLNRGKMVIVGAPFFIRSLTKFAQEIAADAYSNLYFAPDMKDAQVILNEHKQNRA